MGDLEVFATMQLGGRIDELLVATTNWGAKDRNPRARRCRQWL
jgi:hypothetical protein